MLPREDVNLDKRARRSNSVVPPPSTLLAHRVKAGSLFWWDSIVAHSREVDPAAKGHPHHHLPGCLVTSSSSTNGGQPLHKLLAGISESISIQVCCNFSISALSCKNNGYTGVHYGFFRELFKGFLPLVRPFFNSIYMGTHHRKP